MIVPPCGPAIIPIGPRFDRIIVERPLRDCSEIPVLSSRRVP
jgi:hypothetical protein